MQKLKANGVELAYELHGDRSHPAMLLIMGLGMPLSGWPTKLVEMLVAQGFRVILFDNRDIGRSQILDELPTPNVVLQILKSKIGLKTRAPYQLADMAQDAEGLLDALDIARAHVVGASMGGMIAQLLALQSSDRVQSLTSIMSTTGQRGLPSASKPVQRHMLTRGKSPSPEDRMQHSLKMWQLIGSPGYPVADEERRLSLQRHFDRGMTLQGIMRQMLAIIAASDRTDPLRNLELPSLVIHGEADQLVPVECGRATAQAISGSKLVTIPGMGHDLPDALLPRIDQLIGDHARAAGR
jgi:pimeloyl-ACP methyl ester carboxylesterase